jgi:hypothetical protein
VAEDPRLHNHFCSSGFGSESKEDKKAGTNFCFIPSASIALPVAIAHKNFLEYFTFPPLLPQNSTGLSACILGTTSLSSFLGVNWGSIKLGEFGASEEWSRSFLIPLFLPFLSLGIFEFCSFRLIDC